jgi:hypothetical protein
MSNNKVAQSVDMRTCLWHPDSDIELRGGTGWSYSTGPVDGGAGVKLRVF